MKWFQNIQNFQQALHPFFVVMKINAVIVLTYDRHTNKLELKFWDKILITVATAFNLWALYVAIGNGPDMDRFLNSKVMSSGFHFIAIYASFASLAAPLVNFMLRNKIIEFFALMRKFGLGIEELGYDMKSKYRYGYLMNFVVLLAVILPTTLVMLISVYSFSKVKTFHMTFKMALPFVYPICSMAVFGYCTIYMLWMINGKFLVLIEVLNMYFKTSPDAKVVKEENAQKLEEVANKLAILHDILSDAIETFNFAFSQSIMMTVGGVFVYSVFTLFYLIHLSYGVENEIAWQATVSNAYYNLGFVIYIVAIIVNTGILANSSRTITTTVHGAINYQDACKRTENLEIFSQQLYHHSPKISCGLFDFDWPLLLMLVSSIFTYIIILLQFDRQMTRQ